MPDTGEGVTISPALTFNLPAINYKPGVILDKDTLARPVVPVREVTVSDSDSRFFHT